MNFSKKQIIELESYLGVRGSISEWEKRSITKIQKFCNVFQYIPGIRMVGIGNSIAMNAANKDSDIDLFVITQKNTLWFVRIIMTFIVSVSGQRKTQKKHAGKICLSFFCTEEALDFSKFSLDNDIYLYYWILTMKPILVKGDIYGQFLAANTWICGVDTKNLQKKNSIYISKKLSHSSSDAPIVVEKINLFLKKIFFSRTRKSYEALGKPFGVIISDEMLKFHDQDQRKIIREKVLEKNQKLPKITEK